MISLKKITLSFGDDATQKIRALNCVDLKIESGEFVIIIGSNGSGKSALLNVIAGVLMPTAGEIEIDNIYVNKIPVHRRAKWISRVFQDPVAGTASDLSIIDNFRLSAIRTEPKNLKIGIDRQFREKTSDMLSILGLGLENRLDAIVSELSGGQRQALTLAMAVMDKSKILLMDEPTSALDPKSGNKIAALADEIIRRYKLTAIFVTHNMKYASQYGSRIMMMKEGKITRNHSKSIDGEVTSARLYSWFND